MTETAKITYPGHPLHGKTVSVVKTIVVNLYPDGDSRQLLAELDLIAHPSLPEPIGIDPLRLAKIKERK